ncbi:PA2169 family four-helix-bundle protein [Blastopirellula sp. JC732]|uniref:PA2169 family four-helix-bundle protein n=1 Tax=Blastopirellula sediminis TaxID=2894196 RepID=A0A9X1MNK3_9BACT|nr:PA2169 family four-helix-bundle protein [Blastopirellula sediminis]MCC9606259.1 PA2169 family four-helix-bundle protein [Blastopirellula sediminis]MCC9630443.1 PA2169 family four-helix-bundle protein [Blastopirellula sediminis]
MSHLSTIFQLDKETLAALRELTRVLHDSQSALTDAAAKVQCPETARLFYDLATRRAQLGHELRQYIQLNAQEPPSTGTLKGEAQKLWMELRSSVSGGKAELILADVERLEDYLVVEYKKLIPKTAGSPLSAVFHEQFIAVKQGREQVDELRRKKRQ